MKKLEAVKNSPCPELVNALEQALSFAKEGRIVSYVGIGETIGNGMLPTFAINPVKSSLFNLAGMLSYLQNEINLMIGDKIDVV